MYVSFIRPFLFDVVRCPWAALLIGVLTTRSRVRRQTGRTDLGGRRKPTVTSDDWDTSKWDPDLLDDIERRGRPTE